MQDLFRMMEEAAPFAGAFGLIGGIMAWIVLSVLRRRKAPLLLTMASALYLGFLLHGTVISRISGWSDLLRWNLPDFDTVWWAFELGARTQMTAIHAVLNAALFLPFGLIGMCWQRRAGMGAVVLLFGILTSTGIEFFQVCHGMVFDLGDVLTNSVGTAVGCVIGLPAAMFNGWRYRRRKVRMKRKPS